MTYVNVTLLRQDARDLNYWVLRKLDNDCYSESSKLQFERIHKALLTGIHGAERVPELEKENMELKERIKELEENPLLSLTYNELESVFYIVRAVDESSDDRMAENCRSASKKLCQALKRN